MDMNSLTEKSETALSEAQIKALQHCHQEVDVEHLLLSLLEQEKGLAMAIFHKAQINVEGLKKRLLW